MKTFFVTAIALSPNGYNRGGHYWAPEETTHELTEAQLAAVRADRAHVVVVKVEAIE